MRKIKLVDVSSVLGNLGTLAVAGLAFWAYFFTSLPDDIARQYRTEISDLNEQLSDLRIERRKLESDATIARDALSQLNAERQSTAERLGAVQQQLESIQTQLKTQISRIEDLRKSRSTLLRDVVAFRLETALVKASSVLATPREDAELASTIQDFERWFAERKTIKPPKQEDMGSFRVWQREHGDWMRQEPKSWWLWDFRNSGLDRNYTDPKVDDVSVLFRQRISEDRAPVTGRSIVEKLLPTMTIGGLTNDDLDRLRKYINDYVADRKALFGANVVMHLPMGEPSSVVANAGRQLSQTIDDLDTALHELPAAVAARFLEE